MRDPWKKLLFNARNDQIRLLQSICIELQCSTCNKARFVDLRFHHLKRVQRNFSFSLAGVGGTGGRRTLGYQFTERILPLNRRLYVLGAASDSSGELVIQKPREKGQFIISLKSEEELLKSSKSGMTWSLVGSIACFVIGIGCIILDVLNIVQ